MWSVEYHKAVDATAGVAGVAGVADWHGQRALTSTRRAYGGWSSASDGKWGHSAVAALGEGRVKNAAHRHFASTCTLPLQRGASSKGPTRD